MATILKINSGEFCAGFQWSRGWDSINSTKLLQLKLKIFAIKLPSHAGFTAIFLGHHLGFHNSFHTVHFASFLQIGFLNIYATCWIESDNCSLLAKPVHLSQTTENRLFSFSYFITYFLQRSTQWVITSFCVSAIVYCTSFAPSVNFLWDLILKCFKF